ncbi:MAG: PDZ domain-containing protein [Fimbriimonas ginsengisoli]|uniref:PDZ domain-containing protein n=1 Tax=Fimbriimonas ginsengisoli TaxID=1005039 RepID=A0A931LU93_FIMGI|nr:PDZ domain-containing protein [Fimbriimonas ginsengisoli]MBI3722030.1 PDZ domain-containing protein [Fimbriimonas ginsengisoli]
MTRRLAPFLIPVLFLLSAVVPAQVIDADTKREVLKGVVKIVESNAFVPGVDFSKVQTYLDAEQTKLDNATTEDGFRDAVNEALHKFGLSHIVMFSPRMVRQRRENSAVGIGILVQLDKEGLIIQRVMAGTPAAEAGLEPGDVIIEVNGKKPESLVSIMGVEGEPVKIKVRRFSGKAEDFTLRRRKFSTVRPEKLTWVDKETAVLSVYTFDLTYNRGRIESLMEEAGKAKNLVLDLRNNPGGAVINMSHLLGLFLPPDKPIGTFISKRLVTRYVEEQKGKPDDLAKIAEWSSQKVRPYRGKVGAFSGRVAVLINSFSGSAAEIAAQALREELDAPVIGEKSAGMVLVSMIAPLPHDFQIQYPVTDYVSAQGVRLEGKGVVPDLQAQDARVQRSDLADIPLEKAVALLHRYQTEHEGLGTGVAIH